MGIGLGIVLLLLGLILGTGAVKLPDSINSHVDSHALGWILGLLGLLALVLALVMNAQRNRTTTHVEKREL